MQTALRALDAEPGTHIVLEHTALALATRGKLKDAIAEAKKLIQLHPKEALHHDQLALVYLEVGAGEASRREARKAVGSSRRTPTRTRCSAGSFRTTRTDVASVSITIAPVHARRSRMRSSSVRLTWEPGSISRHCSIHNGIGRRFDMGADLKGASESWKAAYGLDGDEETGNSRTRSLLWAGDFSLAETWGRTLPQGDTRNILLVASIAAGPAGPSAAIREASSLARGPARTTLLDGAAGILMLLRQYDAFRALKTEAGTFTGPQAQMMKHLARVDGKSTAVEDIPLALMQAELDSSRVSLAFVDPLVRDEQHKANSKGMTAFRKQDLMTTAVLGDIVRSMSTVKLEGDDKAWRLELTLPVVKATFYAVGDKSAPRVMGSSDAPQGVGRYVLRLIAKGDETTALRLLDWLGQDLAAQHTGVARMFSAVWGTNLPRTKQAQELAAAIVAEHTDADRLIPILSRCGATTTQGQFTCDFDLARVYAMKERWGDLEAHARAWATRSPKSGSPVADRAVALAHLGRFDEAVQLVDDALAADPDDFLLAMTGIEIAAGQGKLDGAIQRIEALAKNRQAPKVIQNELAWMKLVEGSDLPGALDAARQAVTAEPGNRNVLHTLASILAEQGEVLEARKMDWDSMEADGAREPGGEDLYVHGRILEQLGLDADAIAAYRKIPKRVPLAPGSYDLATRRLRVLGATPVKK